MGNKYRHHTAIDRDTRLSNICRCLSLFIPFVVFPSLSRTSALGNFSLIHGAWIPVRFADGAVKRVAPFEITAHHKANPVVAFAWPRADFDLAAHELLIGLLAAVFSAQATDPAEWITRLHEPPEPEELKAALEPFAEAFTIDGDGPRFLQDFEALQGEDSPVDALLIEAPGANTVKYNKDLFVKRAQIRVLSRAAAAMALYTLQQFAPSGGAGHRTSLRGGGPLVTLALPDGAHSPATLWQRLWLNTPGDLTLKTADHPKAFAWLAPTRISDKKDVVHEADSKAHKLQAFFGMPRRIRLVFKDNVERLACDLTGEIDDIICTGFISVPWGVNYGQWMHPASPYYSPKSKAEEVLPVHAPEGRLGYRQWLGLVFEDDGSRIARTVADAKRRLRDLGRPWRFNSRLLAGGYAMDNMKALAFAEVEMPLHDLDPALMQSVQFFAKLMVNGSSEAAKIIGMAIKRALYGEKADIKFDSSPLVSAKERLWELTEASFHNKLDEAISWCRDVAIEDPQKRLAQGWRNLLEKTALSLFDDTAPIEAFEQLEPEDVVEGRKLLVFAMLGYGKLGKDFFKALTLDPPPQK